MDSSVCPHCFKKFHDSSSKNRHIRKIHSVEIDIKPKISHIICPKCPDDNKQSFASYILLMSHISDDHKIVIKQETIKFTSNGDFENWRALEKRSVNYAKQNVVHKINTTITYYNCNRSNSHGHRSTCSKRALKREGSIKINGVCPSRIIAHHDNHSGEVEVNFVETHVGHNMDIRSQRLTIKEENEVVAKLKAGVSTERIIRDARKFNEGKLNRYNLLSKQDLANYRAKHDIANKRDSNDMVAVTKVQESNSNIDKDTQKKITIESWRSTTLNYLNDFCNWDDASFEKLVPHYNSFLNKISQHQSVKRKMEKQTYFPNKQKRRK